MSRAALFGKLPAHGDFVARGLDADARDRLDAWLSASLVDARAAFGDAYEAQYDGAAPWRFAFATPEGGWTAGAVALSADAAGRRFPLYAAREGVAEADARGMAAATEALLYRAIVEGLTVDAAFDALLALTPAEGDGDVAPPDEAAPPPDLVRRMLAAVR